MRIVWVAVCFLAFVGVAGAADQLPKAPMLPQDIKCDAKIGQAQMFEFVPPDKAFTVTGGIKITAPRKSAQYVPAVFVSLIGRGDGRVVGLKAFIEPQEPDHLQIGIQVGDDSTKIISWPWRNSPANFIVALTVEGELKVDVGGLVGSAPLPGFDPERIQISCSTGKVEFQRFSAQAW